MNIERTNQARPVRASTMQQKAHPHEKNAAPGNTGKTNVRDAGTQVKLSQLTQQLTADSSHDVDTERLAEIKAKMDAGELHLDSDKIASALVRDIFRFS